MCIARSSSHARCLNHVICGLAFVASLVEFNSKNLGNCMNIGPFSSAQLNEAVISDVTNLNILDMTATVAAVPFGTAKTFHGRIRRLEWCPQRDVVAVLDAQGELRVLRIWDPIRMWTPHQTNSADMVTWSPDGSCLTAINTRKGSATTFEVEGTAASTVNLPLLGDEAINGASWAEVPLPGHHRSPGTRTAWRMPQESPSSNAKSAAAIPDRPPHLLIVLTSRGSTFVVLNGAFIISHIHLAPESPYPPIASRRSGLNSWVVCRDESLTLQTLVHDEPHNRCVRVSATFPGAVSTFPTLAKVSLLLEQGRQFAGVMQASIDGFGAEAKTISKLQRDTFSKLEGALAEHGYSTSSVELLKELLLRASTIDIMATLSDPVIKKTFKKAETMAKASMTNAVRHCLAFKAASEDCAHTIGDLQGVAQSLMAREECTLHLESMEGLLSTVGHCSVRMQKAKHALFAVCKQYMKLLDWLIKWKKSQPIETEVLSGPEMHWIIEGFVASMSRHDAAIPASEYIAHISLAIKDSLDQLASIELLKLIPAVVSDTKAIGFEVGCIHVQTLDQANRHYG
ncbi:hypothetical protein BC831DRAFT_302068 [Entophlyctis helioformis]|nr:hypothetical protein BC831DRAFT_302068 [Entophlyctis helioformis]